MIKSYYNSRPAMKGMKEFKNNWRVYAPYVTITTFKGTKLYLYHLTLNTIQHHVTEEPNIVRK